MPCFKDTACIRFCSLFHKNFLSTLNFDFLLACSYFFTRICCHNGLVASVVMSRGFICGFCRCLLTEEKCVNAECLRLLTQSPSAWILISKVRLNKAAGAHVSLKHFMFYSELLINFVLNRKKGIRYKAADQCVCTVTRVMQLFVNYLLIKRLSLIHI